MYQSRILPVAILLVICGTVSAKDGRTYYTDERIVIGRANVAKYEWAKALQKRILETGDTIKYYIGPTYTSAKKFAEQGDEFMWLLQPTTKLPRTYDVSFRTICPKCGVKVKKINVWNAWRIDPITHPYQVQCQMCSRWYPSNKYHEGDMTSGDFPDDGSGWLHTGKRYHFMREYAHMCYGSVVVPTLRSLSQAWLLTGDATYAHKGCILLARLATEYPNYGWDHADCKLENRYKRTYVGHCGGTHPHYKWKKGGMITDLIWETFCLEATAYAYDAFYDYMATDPALITFLKAKGMPIEDAAGLRRYIEDYLFRAAMNALLKGMIKGNEGFHQAAALAVALVMDDYSDRHPNSKDMVDYAYHGIGQSAYMMVNGMTRDGGGHESPNYNRIKCDFIRVAELMAEIRKRHAEKFPPSRYPDLFAHPKARGLFDYYIDVLVLDTFLPSIGDCGGIQAPSHREADSRKHSVLTGENLYAFKRYGDPRYARAATRFDGRPYGGELWEAYPADAIARAIERPESKIVRTSRLLDGYGLAILESGEWPQSRAATLNYTSLIGHRQKDPLTLQVFARFQLPARPGLSQDLGLPVAVGCEQHGPQHRDGERDAAGLSVVPKRGQAVRLGRRRARRHRAPQPLSRRDGARPQGRADRRFVRADGHPRRRGHRPVLRGRSVRRQRRRAARPELARHARQAPGPRARLEGATDWYAGRTRRPRVCRVHRPVGPQARARRFPELPVGHPPGQTRSSGQVGLAVWASGR